MMTMKKMNKKYRQVSSLKELREERAKLDNRIEITEIELRHDLRSVQDAFSFQNILGMAQERFPGVATVVNGVLEGFSMVSSLIGTLRRRFSRS